MQFCSKQRNCPLVCFNQPQCLSQTLWVLPATAKTLKIRGESDAFQTPSEVHPWSCFVWFQPFPSTFPGGAWIRTDCLWNIYIYILINPHHMILNRIPGLLGLIHPYWWCLKGISTGIGCQIWFVCSNSRNAWSVRTSCTPAEYASSIFVNLVVERNQLTKGDMSFSIPFMYPYPFLSNQKF